MTNEKTFEFETKMWKRSQNSYATTIPQNILLISRAPTPTENTEVKIQWEINENGQITITFKKSDTE